jgi:hypothetical protein
LQRRGKIWLQKGRIKLMDQKEKDILWAASQFLYDDLPDNYRDWSEKELNYFLEKNAWEPFEDWDGAKLWAHIQDLAVSMRKYVEAN